MEFIPEERAWRLTLLGLKTQLDLLLTIGDDAVDGVQVSINCQELMVFEERVREAFDDMMMNVVTRRR